MKLSALLEHHQKSLQGTGRSDDVLARNLGDGFLMAKNSIFRAIRHQAVEAGFRFSHEPDEAYRALPLSQLDRVMRDKKIPYVDNVAVLREVEAQAPNQILWDDVVDGLKGNSIFHESCHAVFRGLAPKLFEELRRDLTDSEAEVLSMLLEESFANACELLSIIDAEDQAHRIFLELNSYVYMLPDRSRLKSAIDDVGFDAILRLMLLSYLHANFLRPIGDREFERILALAISSTASTAKLDAKSKKPLRSLTKIAFELNPRFREVTTRFHLRLHGLKKPMAELLGFDFMRAVESNSSVRELLKAAATFWRV